MKELKLVPISTMGQVENNRIYINKTLNAALLVDFSCEIIVEKDVNAIFVDVVKFGNITFESKINSNVEYLVFDSQNTNRYFNINGKLKYTEISLTSTNESLNISLFDENSESYAKRLCILADSNSKFVDYIDHKNKNTISNISNIGVAFNSNIIFDVTGKIEKGMSKTKCQQLSRGIVMDDNSTVTAKPILLIDEYDCFANHGATIGKMSDEDLFYLMSRGLSKKEAFMLILSGIINPFIEAITIEGIKDKISSKISNMIEK